MNMKFGRANNESVKTLQTDWASCYIHINILPHTVRLTVNDPIISLCFTELYVFGGMYQLWCHGYEHDTICSQIDDVVLVRTYDIIMDTCWQEQITLQLYVNTEQNT